MEITAHMYLNKQNLFLLPSTEINEILITVTFVLTQQLMKILLLPGKLNSSTIFFDSLRKN